MRATNVATILCLQSLLPVQLAKLVEIKLSKVEEP